VIFDAVGTLIHPEPSVAAAYGAVARRHGVDLPEWKIQERFRQTFAAQERLDQEKYEGRTDRVRELNRWRDIVRYVFGAIAQSEEIFADLWTHFGEPGNWRLFADAADTWQRLETQGLVLGIASNFDHRLLGICQALPPFDTCRHLFVSSRVGWRKPHPRLFATIAEQLALAPQQILLVGDDLENDYHAARDAGWQALLLDRRPADERTRRPAEGVPPHDAIHSLREIVSHLREPVTDA